MKILFQILICFSLFSVLLQEVNAQNLIPNSSFEDENICVEFTAPCAPEAWFYIKPTSNPIYFGRTGVFPILGEKTLVVPIGNVYNKKKFGPFVYTMLTCPLVKGVIYKLSFYLNTSSRKFQNLDIVFGEKDFATEDIDFDKLKPSITITDSNIIAAAKSEWKVVEYEYTAKGNEAYFLLGNISKPINLSPGERMYKNGDVFCFIDDLKLMPLTPMVLCKDYQLNLQLAYSQDYRHTEFRTVKLAKDSLVNVIIDTIVIPDVFFETGSAVIKNTFLNKMDSVSKIITSINPISIRIVGHTDNVGTFESNKKLSDARASAVAEFFTSKIATIKEKILLEGKSFNEPRADNATKEGRAKNRRVEIYLSRLNN